MSVSYQVIPAQSLTAEQESRWRLFRVANPAHYSPFLAVEFLKTIARSRPNCKVVVIQQDGQDIGYLPFEPQGKSAFPIARQINDAQAIIASPESNLDWHELLRGTELGVYHFHALVGKLTDQERSSVFATSRSFMCDLRKPTEGYLKWLKKSSRTIAKQQQKTNKLTREIGPLRWDFDNRDHQLLDRVLDLKSAQYRRTNIFDKFSIDWIRQMLHDLLNSENSVRGQLSLLWAGDRLVSGHYGLRECKLLHYWFPVYDPQFEIYSPGTALFVELVRNSEVLGIDKIDYGYGDLPYKHKLCNVVTDSYRGAFCTSNLQLQRLRLQFIAYTQLKKIPAKETIKRVCRKVWPSWGAREHGG